MGRPSPSPKPNNIRNTMNSSISGSYIAHNHLTSDVTDSKRTQYPALPMDRPSKFIGHWYDSDWHDDTIGRIDQIGHRAKTY
ncbi:hypothetical protein DERF_004883 [Dermatophagoides farinae]|uniref:Uncharacterized protein n=1 Tax=Dermatophagoides farinae TaxID=6954 RepID=A0A922I4L6_DERFA|nr:hypothetical protein DERF_004883 [Dermatophagoides farinae]